ncbi:hypothetical protein Poli38472_009317 [Pythium oligandrum]|uniref:Uncharacterized protein n=1 Tax=Pythium oligandrum TaxID=41045 RepID=A0A8K1CM47_PYTOL|nr:hypothetical protein Poli38472_009317 [Pythium oligandrum]|eukprot:TMW65150.1 hypothetical protein Poli38472_009317 [Pythium oligandrum]
MSILLEPDSPSPKALYVRSSYRETDYVDSASRQLESSDSVPHSRFIAGEAFFNYAAFGSLREGLPSVNLFTSEYIGLIVNAIFYGFSSTFGSYAFQPLLVELLATYHEDQIEAAQSLVMWPGTLSVFMGLVSDCFPIFGYRRKSYIILGWLLACAMYIGMLILHQTADAASTSAGNMYMAFAVIAAFAMQLTWITSLALTVEYAQREHLYERGHLQALYLILVYGAAVITQIVVEQLTVPSEDGMSTSWTIDLSATSAILAVSCLLPLPFIMRFLTEDRTSPATTARLTLGTRMRELWNLLRQKVVYCIFFYLVGTMFLLSATSDDMQTAVMMWSGVSPAKSQKVVIAMTLSKFVSLLMWKSLLLNFNWRKQSVLGVTIFVLSQVALNVPASVDSLRSDWYYYVMRAIGEIPQGWLEVFIIVLPTEIADIGREGAAMGLVNSFLVLITIGGGSLWDSLNKGVETKVTAEEILADSAETRHSVMVAAIIYAVINLLGVVMAVFMPAQKLDAQQLRAFGGYNSMARNVIVLMFVLLVIYDFVVSIALL